MIRTMNEQEKRIVVEIFSHEEAARLRAEMQQMDQRHQAELDRLEKRIQGLHSTLYECLDALGSLKSKHR